MSRMVAMVVDIEEDLGVVESVAITVRAITAVVAEVLEGLMVAHVVMVVQTEMAKDLIQLVDVAVEMVMVAMVVGTMDGAMTVVEGEPELNGQSTGQHHLKNL